MRCNLTKDGMAITLNRDTHHWFTGMEGKREWKEERKRVKEEDQEREVECMREG